MKRVIITGVTGQDGSLLKKFLEKKKSFNSWVK